MAYQAADRSQRKYLKRVPTLHEATLADVESVQRVASYLDQLSHRFKGQDARVSLANYAWVAEQLSPCLPKLVRHTLKGRRLQVEAQKLAKSKRPPRPMSLMAGPIGRLP